MKQIFCAFALLTLANSAAAIGWEAFLSHPSSPSSLPEREGLHIDNAGFVHVQSQTPTESHLYGSQFFHTLTSGGAEAWSAPYYYSFDLSFCGVKGRSGLRLDCVIRQGSSSDGFAELILRGAGQTLWTFYPGRTQVVSFDYGQNAIRFLSYNRHSGFVNVANLSASGSLTTFSSFRICSVPNYEMRLSKVQFPQDEFAPIRVLKVCTFDGNIDVQVELIEVNQQSGLVSSIAQRAVFGNQTVTGLALSPEGRAFFSVEYAGVERVEMSDTAGSFSQIPLPPSNRKIASMLAHDDSLTIVRTSSPDVDAGRAVASVTWFTPATGYSVLREFSWINRHLDLLYRGLPNGSLVVAGESTNGNLDIVMLEKNGVLRPIGTFSGLKLEKASTHIEVNAQVVVAARNELENGGFGVRVKQFDLPK